MEKNKSLGVKLFAVFFIVSGIIFGGLSLFLSLVWISFSTDHTYNWRCPFIYFFLLAIMVVISNIAMLFLKEWGRKTYLFCVWFLTLDLAIFTGFSINEGVHDPARVHAGIALIFLVSLIISLYSTFYLTRPKVKEQFK
jgi:hypothetical protein